MIKIYLRKLSILSLLVVLPAVSWGLIEINNYQSAYLEGEVRLRLRQLLEYWQDGNAQVIYDDYADRNSQLKISYDDFKNRLLQKDWYPVIDEQNLVIKSITFASLSRAFVIIDIKFSHKRNDRKTYVREVLLNLSYEETDQTQNWHFDLLPLLRSNF